MKYILKKYLAVTGSIVILITLIPGVSVSDGIYGIIYSSFILFLLLYIFKPLLNIIMLPINLLTLNLSSWILGIVIFFIWTILASPVNITEWHFNGINAGPIILSSLNLVKWQVIIIAGVLQTIILKIIEWIIK